MVMKVEWNTSAAYAYSNRYAERMTRLQKPKSRHLDQLRGVANPEGIRIATCITSDLFLTGYTVVDRLEAWETFLWIALALK